MIETVKIINLDTFSYDGIKIIMVDGKGREQDG